MPGSWQTIREIEQYSGNIQHASNWDSDFSPSDRVVAIIGNGVSGIYLVANLQEVAPRIRSVHDRTYERKARTARTYNAELFT